MPLNYGHCVARRRKKLPADSESCEQFTEKEETPVPERYVFRIEKRALQKLEAALKEEMPTGNNK